MNVTWVILIPALLLLFFPVQILLPSSVVFRVYEQTPPRGTGRFPWWWTSAVWLDPICGFGGAFLLDQYVFSVPDDAKGFLLLAPALATFVCVLVSLLFRMPARRDRRAAFAPLGFSVGLVFALMPPLVAAIGIILALCAVGGFRHFGAAFVAGAAAVAAAGILFKAPHIEVVTVAILVGLPFVFSTATYRVLTFPSRR
ncbi:hypothetical protein K0B96_07605 [Horticoccus luteus]|uniref:Uncharacterized protein n=1 Tax=Horticoccus luteus TaxID=2862869 RepID=A0A8F9TZP0_9BACT|nr:hypothetical protein [Horticoccus luteus]QYM80462.1 hypothetical protein K0B96_07605 [Horticoccus luteus]